MFPVGVAIKSARVASGMSFTVWSAIPVTSAKEPVSLQIGASKATVRTAINQRALFRGNVVVPEVLFDVVHIAAIGSSADDEGLVACRARHIVVRDNVPDETGRRVCRCISGNNCLRGCNNRLSILIVYRKFSDWSCCASSFTLFIQRSFLVGGQFVILFRRDQLSRINVLTRVLQKNPIKDSFMLEYSAMVAVQLGAQTSKRLLRGAAAQRCNPR
jgi:hypothetical protein